MAIEVYMELDEHKKHSFKYKATYPQPDKSEGAVSSIYVSKVYMDHKAWGKIKLTIEEVS